ncbi:MAG: RrF2 family transcriptional regulator [Bacteroidales bacterium]
MAGLINISRAASLGIHAALLIKRTDVRLNAVRIAHELNASEHHVAKILQKMAKHGILASQKGPYGGFSLNRPADQIQLLEIYELIEGPLTSHDCPEKEDECPFGECLWGQFGKNTSKSFKNFLEDNTLADFS